MDNRSSRQFKIQTIVCKECEKILGGKIVDKDLPAVDNSFYCGLCLLNICDLADTLEIKHMPGSFKFQLAFYDHRTESLDFLNRANKWRYAMKRILGQLPL